MPSCPYRFGSIRVHVGYRCLADLSYLTLHRETSHTNHLTLCVSNIISNNILLFCRALSPIVHKRQTYRGAFVFPGSHLWSNILRADRLLGTDRSSCSSPSSSFRFIAVHSLGELPPPTVYLAHMIVVF